MGGWVMRAAPFAGSWRHGEGGEGSEPGVHHSAAEAATSFSTLTTPSNQQQPTATDSPKRAHRRQRVRRERERLPAVLVQQRLEGLLVALHHVVTVAVVRGDQVPGRGGLKPALLPALLLLCGSLKPPQGRCSHPTPPQPPTPHQPPPKQTTTPHTNKPAATHRPLTSSTTLISSATQPSTTWHARMEALRSPVWPTMSGLAKLMRTILYLPLRFGWGLGG